MEILWLAIILYSAGLGLILHLRPALMFNENGTWKEFGYQRSSRDRHTLFPFWLFAITWAFVSYAIAASITWIIPVATAATAVASEYADSDYDVPMGSEDTHSDDDDVATPVTETIRRGRGRPRKSPRPGYYVIDPDTEKSGIRKYVYYGSQPPQDD